MERGTHLEAAVFEVGLGGEIVRTVGRTGDNAAVAAALDGIAREVAVLRGDYPTNHSAEIRPLRGVSDAAAE